MDWTFFDKIYCLNSYDRKDRYNNVKKIFEKYNIPIDFFQTNSTSNHIEDCFNSHLGVIKDAAYHNYNNILIFEDDINANDLTQSRLNNIIDFIKEKNGDFDIFYLGSCPDIYKYCSSIVDLDKKIYTVRSKCGYAYILNKNTINRLKDLKFNEMPIELYYNDNLKKSYSIYPQLFYQDGFDHPINKEFNIHKKIPKLVTWYSKIIETYSYYLGWSIPLFLLVLAIIIVIGYEIKLNIIFIFVIFLTIIFLTITGKQLRF